jgi:hypothetical protein
MSDAKTPLPPMPEIHRFALLDASSGEPISIEGETHFVTERDYKALRSHLIEIVGFMRHPAVPQNYVAFALRSSIDGPAAIVRGDTRFVKKSDALALRRIVMSEREACLASPSPNLPAPDSPSPARVDHLQNK